MIDSAFYSILSSNSAMINKLGDEIYLGFVPQPSDQYLTIQKPSHNRPSTIDNVRSLETASYQIDIYCKSSVCGAEIAQIFIDEFHLKSASTDEHQIKLMRVDNESTSYDFDTKMFGRRLDVTLYFN